MEGPAKVDRAELERVAALPGFDELAAEVFPAMTAMQQWMSEHPQPGPPTAATVGTASVDLPQELDDQFNAIGHRAFDWAQANGVPWHIAMSAIVTRIWNLRDDQLDIAAQIAEELWNLEERAEAVEDDFRS